MQLLEGKIFKFSNPDEVIDHLRSVNKKVYVVNPNNLKVVLEQDELFLIANEGLKPIFPIRKVFLHKLLRWFKIPPNSIEHLSDETLTSICNENLASIYGNEVRISVENGEAVTITGPSYTPVTDLEIIEHAKELGISTISRDDFIQRIFTKKISESKPVENDICGYGFNIANSETGFSPIKIEHFIFRYLCSNGATAQINQGREILYHYRKSKQYLFSEMDKTLVNANKSRKQLMDKLEISTEIGAKNYFPDISFKVNAILPGHNNFKFFSRFSLESSKYDLFNFITDNAKRYDALTRYQLEQLAGNIVLN